VVLLPQGGCGQNAEAWKFDGCGMYCKSVLQLDKVALYPAAPLLLFRHI
jgi:hypothetical protein